MAYSDQPNVDAQDQLISVGSTNKLDDLAREIRFVLDEDENNIEEIQRLLLQWPEVSPDYLDKSTSNVLATGAGRCLERACSNGDLQIVSSLIRLGRLVASGVDDSMSPIVSDKLKPALIAAAISGHVLIVNYLLENGAKVTPLVPLLSTNAPLDIDLVPIFEAYVDHGWDINLQSNGTPILQYLMDREPLVRWFLTNGADPNILSDRGKISALGAAAGSSTPAVVDLLLSHGSILSEAYPIHQAVARNDTNEEAIQMIDHFLDLGVDINFVQFENHPELAREISRELGTPLHWAAQGGRIERVLHLLKRGADASKLSSKGRKPAEWAKTGRRANREIVELLDR